ncbi:WD repeat-containing protein 73 isoform X2 [Hemicordylus capensis]|uniref:WD repeat-containing protein 73 isoform X2 n=1 Tax=Hemicordylus capensis TaxID=884348 RepID=UPI0023044CD3|nr:WD repeat-containing protein 73 isoform X2 [Hemicordylus capensis]
MQQQQQEEEEEEEEAEAWLLDSLRLYNDLHVFELQDPSRVIEWTGEKRICVAGYDHTRRNEIIQLLLPQRLYVKENQGLCPERDFKVECGGFSNQPVYSLKHVPETSLLVTSGPREESLQVWGVAPEESDVIKPLGTIPTARGDQQAWTRIATTFSKSAWVLHGLTVGSIQVTEIESKKTVFTAASSSTEEVSTLAFLDPSTVLACTPKGELFLADVRQPRGLLGAAEGACVPPARGEERWCAAAGPGPQTSGGEKPLLARLSSGGRILLTESRNLASPVRAAECCVPTAAPRRAEFLSISFAPLLRDCVAVSGFDGTVHVYDPHDWAPSPQQARPLFVHKGHLFSSEGAAAVDAPLVTTHTWHPGKPRTLLSAASDGSLHVWDWAEPRGAS